MSFKNFKRVPLKWLYIGGGLLLIIGGLLWCYKMSTDPQRVFWATVKQGLTTRGVTLEADQTNSGATLHEVIHYSLGVNNLSHGTTILTQQGTIVHSETLGTPTVDYTRYTGIKTNQKRADGRVFDFSRVIGVWAKGQEGQNQLFQQALLGTALPLGGMGVPIGYVRPEARQALMRQIRNDNAYQVSFSTVKKMHKNGRLLYVYNVNLQPVAYVALVKQFAKDVGLHQLDQLDPQNYVGQKPLAMTIVVDMRAHHVVEASLPTGNVKQLYTSYDVPVSVSLPKNPITTTQLQGLLTKVQQ